MVFVLLLLVTFALSCTYYYLTRNYSYWKKQNVPSEPNPVPGFGHILPMFLYQQNIGVLLKRLHENMGKRSMYGCYFMQTPALIIRDPELIKSVLERNFNSFRNNMLRLHKDMDPLSTLNPFFAKDEIWKESRSLQALNLSTTKLRYIFANVLGVWKNLENYLTRKITKDNDNAEFELKDLFSRVVNEIIANSLFGIDGESFEDEPHDHSLYSLVHRMFGTTTLDSVCHALRFLTPNIADLLGIRLLSKEMTVFTKDQTRKFIRSVLDNPEAKKDFYQFSADKIGIVEEDLIIAQATSLMFGGHDTLTNVLAFTIYRLAINPIIQEKARTEVNLAFKESKDTLTFESVKKLSYLDQVILEALRLNPVFDDIMKICNEEITLQGCDGLTCTLKPGDFVLISTECMQMDEEFWQNPLVFDPERFNPANKDTINKFTYLAFGEGPRACLGKRMGIMIVKTIIALILQNYNLKISKISEGPLKKDPTTAVETIQGGLWVYFHQLQT